MKIAIVGAGNVGGTLAGRWTALGHQVTTPGRGQAVPRDSEVVLFAVPAAALEEAARAADPPAGAVVIDATNPVGPGFAHGLPQGSQAERLQAQLAGVRVVKAFNTVGFNVMADPSFGGTPAVLPYCGDDATAKATVRGLAESIGFAPLDAGPLARARLLEHFALLWISLAMQPGGLGREIGFSLLRR